MDINQNNKGTAPRRVQQHRPCRRQANDRSTPLRGEPNQSISLTGQAPTNGLIVTRATPPAEHAQRRGHALQHHAQSVVTMATTRTTARTQPNTTTGVPGTNARARHGQGQVTHRDIDGITRQHLGHGDTSCSTAGMSLLTGRPQTRDGGHRATGHTTAKRCTSSVTGHTASRSRRQGRAGGARRGDRRRGEWIEVEREMGSSPV
uniref:Uncharacterized protein n=1 Tax=Arundo donax TaxID=35708 RepID=A0A0A8ZIF7_ARUDO